MRVTGKQKTIFVWTLLYEMIGDIVINEKLNGDKCIVHTGVHVCNTEMWILLTDEIDLRHRKITKIYVPPKFINSNYIKKKRFLRYTHPNSITEKQTQSVYVYSKSGILRRIICKVDRRIYYNFVLLC